MEQKSNEENNKKQGIDYLPVVYMRVSTGEQNIETQQNAIKNYCLINNISPIKTYKDIGVSGSKESRPEFDLMLRDMRDKRFNMILVYKLDRIGRSLSHLIRLFEEFNKKDIQFVSVTQSINTSTPEGKMFLQMLMVLSEYERTLIVNRINAGLDRARSEGKKLGRPFGAKDKKRRKKSGYHLRWSSKIN